MPCAFTNDAESMRSGTRSFRFASWEGSVVELEVAQAASRVAKHSMGIGAGGLMGNTTYRRERYRRDEEFRERTKDTVRRYRRRARERENARQRALRRLGREYPDRLEELMREEMPSEEIEGQESLPV